MKVRTKFAIAILTVMVVLSGVVLGSVELFKQQTIAEEKKSLNERANLTARQIETSVESRREEVRLFASTKVSNLSATDAYLPRFVNQTRFFAAQTVAANGTIVDFRGNLPQSQRRAAIGTHVGNRSYVRAALTGTVAVSEPERVPGTNVTILKIAAPIFEESPTDLDAASSADGALVGAIYIDFSNFFTTAKTVRTSEQTVAVYDRVDGDRLTLLRPEKSFERNLTTTQSFGLRGWEWTLRLTRDRSGLEQRLNNLVFIQGLSLLLVLGSLVGLGVWEYRTNLRQAERLLDGFSAIREGNYQYSLSLTAADEWEKISDGFGNLAQGLAARESALREREQRLDVLNRVLRHNVRNEMSIIHNYADIIKDFTDDEQIESAAGKIIGAGSELTALSDKARQIRNALDETGRRHGFDATDLVNKSSDSIGDSFADAEITSTVPADITLVGLPALDTALENVLENACEHNDTDSPVISVDVEFDATVEPRRETLPTVETLGVDNEDTQSDEDTAAETDPLAPTHLEPDETSGVARVSVADNGPGIPEHEYNVLTAGEETALEHGSGLGLWLIFWVVDKSGGDLHFEDNEPRGSIVTMELPAKGPTDKAP